MPQPFNCPTCGAPLNYKGGPDLTINCSFCGTPVIVPPELRTGPIVEPPAPPGAGPQMVGQHPEYAEIERLMRAGNKIEAIKLFRQLTGAGLKEAKDAVEKIAGGRGLEVANYAVVGQPSEIDLTTGDRAAQLQKIGRLLKAGNKIEAIKVYRAVFGVGLREAKDAIERLETTVDTPGAFDLHPATVSSSSRRPLRPPPSLSRLKEESAKLKQVGDNVRAGNKAGAARVLSEVFDLGEAQAGDLVDALADGKTVKIGNVTMEVAKESLDNPLVKPARPRVGGCLAALAVLILLGLAAWFALSANGGDNQLMVAFRNLSPTETAVPTVAPQPTEAPAPTEAPPPTPAPTSTPGVLNVTQVLLGGFGTGHGLFENARSLAVDGAGNIYVGEYEGGLVQVFDADGEYLTEWLIGDENAFLKKLAADKNGIVYAVLNGNIYKFDGMTGEPLGQLSYDGGPGFQDVVVTADGGLAAAWNKDWQGGLFVNFTESQDDLVMFDGEGNVTRVIPKVLSVEAGGNAELETLVAVDGEGNIYLTGLNNDGIFKFTPEGKFVGEFGAYEVAYATAIAADNLGRVFVSASGVIYIFDAEGGYLGFEDVSANGIVAVDEDTLLVLNQPQVWEYTLKERP